MTSSFRTPKEWVRKRKLQNFGLKFRVLGPSEPRNFSPKFCNFLLLTHSFGLQKLEVICLFESGFILKFWFQVVFKHASFYRGRFWHENVAFWVRGFEIISTLYRQLHIDCLYVYTNRFSNFTDIVYVHHMDTCI